MDERTNVAVLQTRAGCAVSRARELPFFALFSLAQPPSPLSYSVGFRARVVKGPLLLWDPHVHVSCWYLRKVFEENLNRLQSGFEDRKKHQAKEKYATQIFSEERGKLIFLSEEREIEETATNCLRVPIKTAPLSKPLSLRERHKCSR